MSSVLEEVRALKEGARTDTLRGKYNEALDSLKTAIDLLSSELENAEEDPRELAIQLADCYGMAGGVCRRMGNLDESIKMYDTGYKYESNRSYKISSSYNLTNRIVIRILKDTDNLITLKTTIKEAAEIVQKQVERKRRREWWAWADLGELYLLCGESKEALRAYEMFTHSGAREPDYESQISVLNELASVLKSVNASVSEAILKAIEYLEKAKYDKKAIHTYPL